MSGGGTAGPDGTVQVRLLQFPLLVYRRAQEHFDELLREFALLSIDSSGTVPGHEVPRRLRELVDELGQRFARATQDATGQREEALRAGLTSVDLTYNVPPQVREGSLALARMLDEADEFCRRGELLTLATPPEVVEFRRWFLDEFVAQADGAAPTPWPERPHR